MRKATAIIAIGAAAALCLRLAAAIDRDGRSKGKGDDILTVMQERMYGSWRSL